MTGSTTTTTTTASTASSATCEKRGFRLQRHVDALMTTTKHYAADKIQRANIATGITMAYAIHSCDVPRATEEERIVLIMGFRMSKEWWAPAVDHLLFHWRTSHNGKSLKILTFDNRGLGSTDAPWSRYSTSQMADDALALMDHVGWGAAHIVGFSLGGMISLELSARFPERVKSLALSSSTRGRFVAEDPPEISHAVRSFSRTPEVIVPSVIALLHSKDFALKFMEDKDSSVHDEMVKYYNTLTEAAPHPPVQGLIGQMLAVATHYVADDRLAQIAKSGFPVLITAGCRDMLPVKESRKLAERITGDHVKLVIYEDGGHSIFLEYPDEFATEIIQNLQRASA